MKKAAYLGAGIILASGVWAVVGPYAPVSKAWANSKHDAIRRERKQAIRLIACAVDSAGAAKIGIKCAD